MEFCELQPGQEIGRFQVSGTIRVYTVGAGYSRFVTKTYALSGLAAFRLSGHFRFP